MGAMFSQKCKSESVSRSVVSDSLWPHGLRPTRLLCPWDSPGKNTWIAISFSRGSSRPRDWTWVACIGGWVLYHWASWGACFPRREELFWGRYNTFIHRILISSVQFNRGVKNSPLMSRGVYSLDFCWNTWVAGADLSMSAPLPQEKRRCEKMPCLQVCTPGTKGYHKLIYVGFSICDYRISYTSRSSGWKRRRRHLYFLINKNKATDPIWLYFTQSHPDLLLKQFCKSGLSCRCAFHVRKFVFVEHQ